MAKGKDEAIKIAVDGVEVTKAWDKAVIKTVEDAARKAAEKAIKGVKGLEPVKSVGKKEKGIGVNLTFPEVDYDTEKKALVLKLSVMLTKYPGPKIASTGSPSRMEATGIPEDKAPKEAAGYAADFVSGMASDIRKAAEKLAKTL